MLQSPVIAKNRRLLEAEDFAFLRARGIEHIQQLSGRLWTDHLAHDPGITTLELFSYALTDLAYRTNFSVSDLLTAADGTVAPPQTSGLFPAHEVLTTAPLTIADYRRLLLRIEGLRNAWLDPMTDPDEPANYRLSEVPLYADCHADALSFSAVNAIGQNNHPVKLTGLYKVLLELEIDDVLGSLNERLLVFQARRDALKGVVISLDSEDPAFAALDFSRAFSHVTLVKEVTPVGKQFTAAVEIELEGGVAVTLDKLVIRVVDPKPKPDEDPVTITPALLDDLLADEAPDGLVPLFWRKQAIRQRSVEKVRCVLNAHRNLCEDVLNVETVQAERVAICADIETVPAADIEELLARVYHEIELYLNPPVRYFTLREMLDDGLCADDIFNGPYVDFAFTCEGEKVFTKPGFIKSGDLEASELRREIHVSDIINIVMDLEGVVAIRNVSLRKYDAAGNPIGNSERWTMPVTAGRQPVLFPERSKVVFYKNGIAYRAKPREVEDTLEHLRAMARKAAYVAPNQVLELPAGRYRAPDRFFSIQHDFPQTYGIGRAGLPTHVDEARVAKARQFKAYLTFYDQVLGDYLAQLGAVRNLFSLDKTVSRTYFPRFLDDIAGVRAAFADEFYVDKAALQDEARRTRLVEDEELFLDRRNRFLDHLLARFAEQFTDYVLMLFSLEGDQITTGKDLIEDKIEFLREYPMVSRERGKAFNYRPEDPAAVWDSDNVSGLEKRVTRLAGMASYQRRDLACAELFGLMFTTRQVSGQFRVEIKAADNTVLFKSQEKFASRDTALAQARRIYPFLRNQASYVIDSSGGNGQVFYRIEGGGASLRHDALFDTRPDAAREIRALIARHDELLESEAACDQEGLHLIEHILLRPMSAQDPLLSVCLDPACEFCGEEDPYSFRITVVLPYWPRRFRNLDFRRFFERMVREETPAHIHARVCWIGNAQMAELDAAYHAWLTQKAAPEIDPAALRDALAELIAVLQRLKTVYPAATLHDCVEDGDDGNPVRLGSTNLGIF
jgi:hypothetical protein